MGNGREVTCKQAIYGIYYPRTKILDAKTQRNPGDEWKSAAVARIEHQVIDNVTKEKNSSEPQGYSASTHVHSVPGSKVMPGNHGIQYPELMPLSLPRKCLQGCGKRVTLLRQMGRRSRLGIVCRSEAFDRSPVR